MAGENDNVLEFSLGDGRYCLDISHVDEIVDATEEVTPVPNSPPHVIGVVDLRGETTTVVDPTVRLDVDGSGEGRRIIVLSGFEGKGLLIDDVHQVQEVDPADVDTTNASETTRGVIRRDDRFVIWIEPDALVE